MRYNVTITRIAELDIIRIFQTYNQKLEGLGNEFKFELEQSVNYLERDAQSIQIRYGNIRILFLKHFPFGVHFRMIKNDILIIGLYATKENPGKWNK